MSLVSSSRHAKSFAADDDDVHDYPRVVTASVHTQSTITARFYQSRAFSLEEYLVLRT
jgi:hypothetical protein